MRAHQDIFHIEKMAEILNISHNRPCGHLTDPPFQRASYQQNASS